VPLLRPDEQVFQAMPDGWRNQQPARNLARSTVEGKGRFDCWATASKANQPPTTPPMTDPPMPMSALSSPLISPAELLAGVVKLGVAVGVAWAARCDRRMLVITRRRLRGIKVVCRVRFVAAPPGEHTKWPIDRWSTQGRVRSQRVVGLQGLLA